MTEAYSFHLAFIFAFLHIQAGCAAEECAVAVSQPHFIEVSEESETVTIHCNFTSSGQCPSIPDVLWHHFQQYSHRKLQTHSSKKYSVKQSGNNRSLRISYIHPNDSGIYFCGISFTKSDSIHSKNTSTGTILVVRAMMVMPYKKLLMIILTVLLFLYSVCIVVLLVLYKPITWMSKITCRRGRKRPSRENKNSTRRTNFRAVAQELYNRRNPRKNRKAGEEISTASVPDDPTIYQNL
ncbi:immunoglobulin superfamily member 6-like isoform X1 [Acipenser oxyrinchus oxyrinchus]|nr:immunoglobulin superfamily member 6-like isoform X1 [Acipenser oxyrinchus oxyrinchus]